MNSSSLLRKRGETCSTLANTFVKSEVLQRSKVNLSFLAVFSAVLIVIVNADEFLEWNASSHEKSRRLPYEWVGAKVGAAVGAAGERRRVARTGTTARYKRNVSDKLRDCCACVSALCAIAIRERAPFLIPRRFPTPVNARKYCRSHYS